MNRLVIIAISLFALSSLVFLFNLNLGEIRETDIVSAQTSSTDWPQLQRDAQHTGFYPGNIKTTSTYTTKWTWQLSTGVKFADAVQAVIAEGILAIGAYDGKVYALDALTGQLKWSFQTNGPILHAAAISNGNVIVGSYDSKIYALSTMNGMKIWEYKTNGSIVTAPVIIDGKVLIGSTDTYFYALNENTGEMIWKYKTGGPIYSVAAASDGKVYFGSEDMFAYALDYTTTIPSGNLVWKSNRLNGQSFSYYWPVISRRYNTVFFRTMAYIPFHQNLESGDSIIEFTDDTDSSNNKVSRPSGNPLGTSQDITDEQNHIISALNNKPDLRSFYAYDTTTGAEKYTAPILYTGGSGYTPVPITIDEIGDRAWGIYRSYYSRFDSSCTVRGYAEVGKLNLSSGRYSPFSCGNPTGPCSTCMNYYEDFHLVADEQSFISAAQNVVIVSNGYANIGGINLSDNKTFVISNDSILPAIANGKLYVVRSVSESTGSGVSMVE